MANLASLFVIYVLVCMCGLAEGLLCSVLESEIGAYHALLHVQNCLLHRGRLKLLFVVTVRACWCVHILTAYPQHHQNNAGVSTLPFKHSGRRV